MNTPISCRDRNIQDPWSIQKRCFFHERRDLDAYTQEERDEIQSRHRGLGERGESVYKVTNHTLSPRSQKKKKDLVEGLKAFEEQSKTNGSKIDESEYIEQVEEAMSDGELDKLEKKFNRAADHYYEKVLKDSGAFTPIHAKEARFLGAEMRYLKENFAERPLYQKGKLNKVDILGKLKESLKPRIAFREKLKKLCKNTMIRDEYISYFDEQLSESGFLESREERLKKIMAEVKEVEEADPAIQNEFRKRQKNRGGKTTEEIKKEVMEEFDEKTKIYADKLLPWKDKLFGGPWMVTPQGKMRTAAWEFLNWFEELESFKKMEDMTKALDGVLEERQEVYEERDAILKDMKPDEAKRIKIRTDDMRFHNLKAYLPELRTKLKSTSIMALEYIALLEDAEAEHVPLFTEEEKIKLKTQMQVADPELQKAKLMILEKETIPERAQVVHEYFALRDTLRDDQTFMRADKDNREAMLKEANAQEARESENPIDLSSVDHFGSEEQEEWINRANSKKGKEFIEKNLEALDKQGKFAIGKVQGQLLERIYGVSKHMEEDNLSQKDAYLEDASFWMKMSKDKYKENINDVSEDSRSRWQVEALEEKKLAYDMGKVSGSGGIEENLQVISAQELKQGKNSTKEKINKARWPQFIMLEDEEGKDELHPHQKILREKTQELTRLLNMVMQIMGIETNLGAANTMNMMNSAPIKEEIARMMVESQFKKHLKVGGEGMVEEMIHNIAA
jgi:hypothetical protein